MNFPRAGIDCATQSSIRPANRRGPEELGTRPEALVEPDFRDARIAAMTIDNLRDRRELERSARTNRACCGALSGGARMKSPGRRVEDVLRRKRSSRLMRPGCGISAKIACRNGNRNSGSRRSRRDVALDRPLAEQQGPSRGAYLFRRIDSLDDLALAKKLDAAAAAEGKYLPVLIEVHLGDEATKSGVAEADLPALADGIAPFAHFDLVGLMTIPPFFDDPELVRPYFRKLRELRDDV